MTEEKWRNTNQCCAIWLISNVKSFGFLIRHRVEIFAAMKSRWLDIWDESYFPIIENTYDDRNNNSSSDDNNIRKHISAVPMLLSRLMRSTTWLSDTRTHLQHCCTYLSIYLFFVQCTTSGNNKIQCCALIKQLEANSRHSWACQLHQ